MGKAVQQGNSKESCFGFYFLSLLPWHKRGFAPAEKQQPESSCESALFSFHSCPKVKCLVESSATYSASASTVMEGLQLPRNNITTEASERPPGAFLQIGLLRSLAGNACGRLAVWGPYISKAAFPHSLSGPAWVRWWQKAGMF